MKALLIIDVWDKHWDKGTNDLMDGGFAKKINKFANKFRKHGLVIHCPSSCVGNYMREPIDILKEFKDIKPPEPFFLSEEKKPISEGPSVWEYQHPDIEVLPDDYILDDAGEIFSLLKSNGIKDVFVVGLHLGLCIMDNKFGVQNLKKYGFNPTILTDMVDTLKVDKEYAIERIRRAGYNLKDSNE